MHPMWISLPHLSRIVIPELHCNFSTTCRKLCPTAAKHPGVFLFTAITLKRRQSDTVPIQTWNVPLGTSSFSTDSFLAKSGTYYTKVSCPGTNSYPELEYTLTVEAVGIPYEKGDVDQDHTIGINDAFLALSAYATVSAGGNASWDNLQ